MCSLKLTLGGFVNNWTDSGYYHDNKGKILGQAIRFDDRYKAMLDKMFLGWYVTEDHARKAVEEAYLDSVGITTPRAE